MLRATLIKLCACASPHRTRPKHFVKAVRAAQTGMHLMTAWWDCKHRVAVCGGCWGEVKRIKILSLDFSFLLRCDIGLKVVCS